MMWNTSTGSGKQSNVAYTWTLIGWGKKKATDTTFCDPAEILVGFGQFSSNGVFRGYDFNPVVV